MALEEISFYNTNGEEINISNLVNQMINYSIAKREIGETQITDFNEGSEIRNLLEMFAVGIYALLEEQHEATRIAFISTSEGIWLDKIGELPFINLKRQDGNEAEGIVRFYIEEPAEEDIIIPAETFLSTEEEIDFITEYDCTIYAGETSNTVSTSCLLEGYEGNVGANTITVINSDEVDTELVSVVNDEAFINGRDNEDDELYRTRLLENVRADGFGTVGWYKQLCENVSRVHDVKLISDENYTRKVLVNGMDKPTTDLTLLGVLTELSRLNNLVVGHTFIVDKPEYTDIDLTITVDVNKIFEDTFFSRYLEFYFNGGNHRSIEFEGLNIGESTNRNNIIASLNIIENVVNVSSVKMNNVEVDTINPATSNHVLRLNSVTVIQNEV